MTRKQYSGRAARQQPAQRASSTQGSGAQPGPRTWSTEGRHVEVEGSEPGPLLLDGLPAPRKQARLG